MFVKKQIINNQTLYVEQSGKQLNFNTRCFRFNEYGQSEYIYYGNIMKGYDRFYRHQYLIDDFILVE